MAVFLSSMPWQTDAGAGGRAFGAFRRFVYRPFRAVAWRTIAFVA